MRPKARCWRGTAPFVALTKKNRLSLSCISTWTSGQASCFACTPPHRPKHPPCPRLREGIAHGGEGVVTAAGRAWRRRRGGAPTLGAPRHSSGSSACAASAAAWSSVEARPLPRPVRRAELASSAAAADGAAEAGIGAPISSPSRQSRPRPPPRSAPRLRRLAAPHQPRDPRIRPESRPQPRPAGSPPPFESPERSCAPPLQIASTRAYGWC
mmetsp:Transcript_4944/g.16323  ORF Transcript_4944/g.16323 Transcript_4944/m.16323 type:complete len:212 (-) Transcript_4944:734-1369(-)